MSSDIKTNLTEQAGLYGDLAVLEEKKTKTIENRDGEALDHITAREEEILQNISLLDEKREEYVRNWAGMRGVSDHSSVTVSMIASENEDSGLMEAALSLKKNVMKVKAVRDRNEKLIKSSLEFFDTLLSGIRESASLNTGYNMGGKENGRVMRSLLFNRTA